MRFYNLKNFCFNQLQNLDLTNISSTCKTISRSQTTFDFISKCSDVSSIAYLKQILRSQSKYSRVHTIHSKLPVNCQNVELLQFISLNQYNLLFIIMNEKNKNYAYLPSNTKQIDYFDDSQQFTKDFQKLLCDSQANNQRWSQPMTIPNPRKIPTYSETPIINEQNVIVIKSDHRESVEDMIDSENIHKLRQKARQLSRTNQKLKQQNLQLRLQKMKLASNSETIRLLELKLEIQQLGKSIAELENQKQGILKAKEAQEQFRLTN